ncbi:hypothetical protein LTR84_004255 [Exophiala bonariae]|uniref:U3 small nucleolar RNA-associated protein 22 n=1 Tax=Exophiala bonariae TaxID=1690606 RepID=A0AAV9N749_9EURO|nr:hypothetical protein LTR84_004255 [Exophiala bonariae]
MAASNIHSDHRSLKRRKLDHRNEDGHANSFVNGHEHTRTRKQLSESHNKAKTASDQSRKSTSLPTGGINKSSVLALQVHELGTELKPNYEKLRTKWIDVANRLESIVKQMSPKPAMTAADVLKSFRKKGVNIPFSKPSPTKETNYKFEFIPPSQVFLQGAMSNQLSIRDDRTIEVKVILPDATLQEKDYLNNRAFHKGAFYIASIALEIKEKANSEFNLSFSYADDVDLLPILNLTPKQLSISKFKFQVSFGLPSKSIPLDKTLPTKNCLRHLPNYEDAGHQQATPFYNSCLRSVASVMEHTSTLESARSPAFDDACRLGQTWLRQRGFSSSITNGGFGYPEWTQMCAILLRGGGHRGHPLFSKQYSSLQFFKAMLQVLSGRDLRNPWVIGSTAVDIPRSELPVFFDVETGVNILFKMSPWSYESLRHHAQISLTNVNGKVLDTFESVFMSRVAEPLLQFDEIFSMRFPMGKFSTALEQQREVHKLHSILVRGLGDRVSLVDFKLLTEHSWALKQDPSTGEDVFEVRLLTNPETVARLVDRGPSAEEPDEAGEFQKFWGDKAERRRFRDGSITESLVWTSGSPVTSQIVRHLALHHFELLPSSVSVKSGDLEASVLSDDASVGPKDAYRLINNTYQSLASALHGLEGLPLPIRSISPTSAALRSSTASHPLLPSTTEPIDILVQFDSSTRWPDSLPAIQHTKIAFLLKLAELLSASDSKVSTRVGLENTELATNGHFNTSFLDIIYPSPAPDLSPICFRTRIYHDREEHLLQTALSDKSLHGSVRDSLATALAAYKRHFIAAPIHTTAIRNLCTRFPSLSSTIRLLKKWISSHLLLHHLPEEVLEIIAAHIFLCPSPWSAPGSPTTAFLRCLHLLSRWDFSITPLVADLSLSQAMTGEQVNEAKTRFQAWRKLDPSLNTMTWFVGTNIDTTGTVWTQGSRPERVVAGRIRALASAAVEMVKERGSKMEQQDWSGLFVSPLDDFDFRIHLKPSVVKHHGGEAGSRSRRERNGGEFKNLQLGRSLDIDSIGYDPVVLFIEDLKATFRNTALFFHDGHGGDVIAGLWRPAVVGKKEWRVRLGWSSVPVAAAAVEEDDGTDKAQCVFNKDAVLAEVSALGEGLVKQIRTKA